MTRMSNQGQRVLFVLSILCWFFAASSLSAQTSLQVTYGEKGLQRLSYRGLLLEDTTLFPADLFHIWHLKSTDLSGNVNTAGQYGWGEDNNGESWNAANNTETYTFSWGTIATQYIQVGDSLNLIVTESNKAGSGILLDGAEIFPLTLHFPVDPAGFNGGTQYAITTTGPGVSIADYGLGVVTAVLPDETQPMYTGWKAEGTNAYSPILTSTAPDGLATFLPHNDRVVSPGSSYTYTLSLRFTPEGTAADATDAYTSFRNQYPSQMTWTDRRIIGTAFLASSPTESDITQPGGFPTNPRRYFNDASIDITSSAGLKSFQNRMLAQATENVSTAEQLGSQGVVTWDIEGEQYAQDTSYVCSPDQIAAVAPEMEKTVLDPTSPWYGQKLDDAYFQTMTGAGLRVGVCLRPQVFALGANSTASQSFLGTNQEIIANLEKKASFANSRWGVTLFYVDSTVDTNGGTLDPAIFQQLITDFPSFLFIPEESTPRYYAYSAPFYSFIFHTTVGTPASILNVYPHGFGATLVNDVSPVTLATNLPQLIQTVRQGDILMGLADFWQANDPVLVSIYAAAGVSSATAPQSTPTISWTPPSGIGYGTALSSVQLDASANVAGTFVYTPAAGTVPGAGTPTLLATFTPADTKDYKQATASVTLPVAQAVPVLTWNRPNAIDTATPLGSSQLDATANVPGSFAYAPGSGALLAAGTDSLTASFTPSDTASYSGQTISVPITVTGSVPSPPPTSTPVPTPTPTPTPSPTPTPPVIPSAPSNPNLVILTPSTGQSVSGTIMVVGLIDVILDPAGTYLMVDGAEYGTRRVAQGPYLYPLDTTTLSNGEHLLQLWAHDIGNNTILSAQTVIQVTN